MGVITEQLMMKRHPGLYYLAESEVLLDTSICPKRYTHVDNERDDFAGFTGVNPGHRTS